MKHSVKHRFEEAVKLKASGNLSGAKLIFSQITKEDPTSTAILAVYGHVCWEMELLEEAVTLFKQATKLSPRLEAVSLGLFHCLWALGRRDQALEEAKRFQSCSDSQDYREIISQIDRK